MNAVTSAIVSRPVAATVLATVFEQANGHLVVRQLQNWYARGDKNDFTIKSGQKTVRVAPLSRSHSLILGSFQIFDREAMSVVTKLLKPLISTEPSAQENT